MPPGQKPKDERTRTAYCFACKKHNKFSLEGFLAIYISCDNCGALFRPVKGDQLGVRDELMGIINKATAEAKAGEGGE